MARLSDVGVFALPDFKAMQLKGFQDFLEYGIIQELRFFSIVQDSENELKLWLCGEEYKLGIPHVDEREALRSLSSYTAGLYVPAELRNDANRNVQKQKVFLGSLPLMSPIGTFIINGVSRVVVSQILRNPGVYFTVEKNSQRKPVHTVTVISEWGDRLKFEIDGKNQIWVRFNRRCKFPVMILLAAMGADILEICRSQDDGGTLLMNSILLDERTIDKNLSIVASCQSSMREILTCLYPTHAVDPLPKNLGLKLREKFELGWLGRVNMNLRLGELTSVEERFLLPQDIVAAINLLLEMKGGKNMPFDDIDHLKNKRVRSVGDLLALQLRISLSRLSTTISKLLHKAAKHNWSPSAKGLMHSAPQVLNLKEFFTSHPLSQFLDQTNPLAEIVHKRKLSVLGPGGLTRRTASFRVRDIHPSQYGRICPIETSEGMNAGLVSSLATQANVNMYGAIESPLYTVPKKPTTESTVYLPPGLDEYYKIATGNMLALSQISRDKQSTPARCQQEFITTPWKQIHLRSILPFQYFSVGACLIPFLEHNDANRALMGSNMQRQAVPLLRPEKAIVGTGLETHIALHSGTLLLAPQDGRIGYVDGQKICLVGDNQPECVKFLLNYQRSNYNTCIHQRPAVILGETVAKGQLLAEAATTAEGELALGKNVLVAYMPWDGYNFEDAVLINERLVYEDVFTSFHIKKYEIEARCTNQGMEEITKQLPYLESHLLRHLDVNGVVCPGAWVETGDVLVGKLTPQEPSQTFQSPEGRLLQAIFGIQPSTSEESSLKVPPGGRGRVIDVHWVYQDGSPLGQGQVIHVTIVQKRKIKVGDKVAGRHGNKGIISRILPRQDMPYLQDGTPVDVLLSPLGVPSRMNVGQVFECVLGLAGAFLGRHYRMVPFDEQYEREASRKLVLSELSLARKASTYPWIFEADSPGKSRLFDGRTGEMFEQPVTVGRAYILKLIHQVDDKIHARSTGPYSLVTQQPLRGRSRRGGQRVGEMEVWALEGFGASCVLQEILTSKSDDIFGRKEVLGAMITGEELPKSQDVPEAFKLLVRELRCLGINVGRWVTSKENLQDDLRPA